MLDFRPLRVANKKSSPQIINKPELLTGPGQSTRFLRQKTGKTGLEGSILVERLRNVGCHRNLK